MDTIFVGGKLHEKELHPSKIISSTLIRARQTAQIMAEALDYTGEIEITEDILPSASMQEMYETVLRYAALDQLLMVGHMPSMGTLAHALIASTGRVNTSMDKSEVLGIGLHLEAERLRGPLLWRLGASI
jgi:phosphohistidine phosphatase